MAQKKTAGSDFNRGWQACLTALSEELHKTGALAFDTADLARIIRVLRKHK